VQAFIRRLRVGDQVDLVYEEALAISVEPMKMGSGRVVGEAKPA
jgi:hypothetical protein